MAYDTTRLWLRKPWYSLEYQDVIKTDSLIPYANTQADKYNILHMTGQKQYEITDHLGNVLATISDFRRPELDTSGTHIGFYKAAIQSATDYYPFGMEMPGRNTVDTTTHFTNISGTVVVPVHYAVNRLWYGSSYFALIDIGFPVLSGTTSATIITANPSDGIYNVIYPIVPGYQHTLTVNVGSGGSTVTLSTAFSAEIWQGTSHIGTSVSSLGSGANILTFTPIGTTPVELRIVNTSMASHAIAIGSITVDSITFVNQYVVSQIASDDGYHYGFNGKYKDNEWAGKGNHLDFGARGLDTRTIRWITSDPSAFKFPDMSPYVSFNDNPIYFIDPDGRENKAAVAWASKNMANKSIPFNNWFGSTEGGWVYKAGTVPTKTVCYESCFMAYLNSGATITDYLKNSGFASKSGGFKSRLDTKGGGISWFKNGNGTDRSFVTDISKGQIGDIVFMGEDRAMEGHAVLLNSTPILKSIEKNGKKVDLMMIETLSTSSDSDPGNYGNRTITFEKQADGSWKQQGVYEYTFRGYGQLNAEYIKKLEDQQKAKEAQKKATDSKPNDKDKDKN